MTRAERDQIAQARAQVDAVLRGLTRKGQSGEARVLGLAHASLTGVLKGGAE